MLYAVHRVERVHLRIAVPPPGALLKERVRGTVNVVGFGESLLGDGNSVRREGGPGIASGGMPPLCRRTRNGNKNENEEGRAHRRAGTASRNQTPMNRQAASASICVQVYVIGVVKTAAKFVYRHSPMQNLSVLVVRDGTCTSSRISNPVTPSATMWLL